MAVQSRSAIRSDRAALESSPRWCMRWENVKLAMAWLLCASAAAWDLHLDWRDCDVHIECTLIALASGSRAGRHSHGHCRPWRRTAARPQQREFQRFHRRPRSRRRADVSPGKLSRRDAAERHFTNRVRQVQEGQAVPDDCYVEKWTNAGG